ncbi:MAG: ROK family protein [Verrucomicrobia bacterium]|nr:ROK family protein [Verrucomicrobiota bacterium]
MKSYLGIEIGGTKLQLVAGTATGRIRHRRRFPVNSREGGAGIRRTIETALPALLRLCPAVAIGVGFGGPVDRRAGRIAVSHQIEGWAGFPLRDWLRRLARRPVLVENDSNLAALGEATRGAGRGFSPVLYTNMGSGVGGGLVVDGRLYHGAPPGEVEIGHLRLDRRGTTVESRCSGWAVDAKIRALSRRRACGPLVRMASAVRGGEARFLASALAAGDPAARRILDETAQDLAWALSHAIHVVHPQVIVLGGGLSLVGEALRAAVARALPVLVMEAFHPVPEVRLAGLGEDAVPVGCLVAAGQRAAIAA